ncbi:MAG: RDD family protein [Polyangiaceae bacterium]|nr:RDD family protein [Polyangiaceae bacterium]
MQFDRDPNPYAAPRAQTSNHNDNDNYGDTQLAGRGARYLARLVDGVLNLLCVVPVAGLLYTQQIITMEDAQNQLIVMAVFGGASLPLNIYQWTLLSRTGQSLGKKWLRIKVVKTNGSAVNFTSGVVLREWLMMVFGLIPMVGNVIGLIDGLMIFREDRRCLHDQFAGTKVVRVLPR